MQIHHENLSDVTLYLETHRSQTLDDKRPEYERLLRYAGKYHPITKESRMLEIGTGTGAVPILAKMHGLNLKGLEISPQLIEHAKKWGAQVGVDPDIELNNLETAELEENYYDVIICSSVFEHVEHWEKGLGKVYRALKPGGVLFFESTNKFALKSGEYPPLFFYGWLPNWMRYRFRIWKHGPDIMKLGIDFHQFTYIGLRRGFRRAGFSKIYDVMELADPKPTHSGLKRTVFNLSRRSRAFRELVLFFFEGTTLVGVK